MVTKKKKVSRGTKRSRYSKKITKIKNVKKPTLISEPKLRGNLEQIKLNTSIYFNHKMNRSMVACGGFWATLATGSLKCTRAPVTGRNWHSYAQHLFADIPKKNLVGYLANKDFLDIGSGLNHIYQDGLVYKVFRNGNKNGTEDRSRNSSRKKAIGMDIHPFPNSNRFKHGSIYNTKLSNSSFDIITSQYLVYYWIDDVKGLKKVFKEIHRILKKGGQFRIYPVFYGDYHYNDKSLMKYIHNRFKVEIYKPRFVMERVRYIDNNDIDSNNPNNNEEIAIREMKKAPPGVSQKEREDHNNLVAHTLILTKK